MLGIVFTQLFWVRKSVDLQVEQIDNSIKIAIKSVLNQLLIMKNDTAFSKKLEELSLSKKKLEVTDVIVPQVLDSLLERELGFLYPNDRYYYGIFNTTDKRFYSGKYQGKEAELIESPYHFSVSGIYQPGDYFITVYYPAKTSIVLRQMELWLLLSIFFLVVVIIGFAYIISGILRQKKISEMRTDFINNLTHEFKTPIATSSLAAEMMLRPEMAKNPSRIEKYAQVILDENRRLQNQVEQILQIATLEKGKQRYKFRNVNIHKLLESVIESFELRFKEVDAVLKIELNAKESIVFADHAHILNVFYNLVDNAIKYTPEKLVLIIKTWNVKNGIYIRVEDNGIGISRAHQSNIFKNLFRVPTGNIHEVRGFGLGLFYSKTVITHHHGRIELESEPGMGSIFDVYLPFKNKNL